MQGALLLSLFLAAASAVTIWEDGKEYIYAQEYATHVGTSDYDSNAGGYRTTADIRIQVSGQKLLVSASNMKRATFNLPYPEGSWPYHPVNETYSKFLDVPEFIDAPFSFTLEHGLVQSIEMPSSVPFWVQNMMRAFASSIQMDTEKMETEREWTVKEKSIHGDCFVQYTFEHNDNVEHAVMTKGVNHLSQCVNRRFRFFSNTNGHTCNADPSMEHKYVKFMQSPEYAQDYATAMHQSYTPTEPLFSDSTTRFYLVPTGSGQYKLTKFFSVGNVVVQPFSEAGASHVSLSNITLTLKEVKSSANDIAVSGGESFDNVEFQFEDGDWSWEKTVDLKAREHFFRMGYSIDEEQETLRTGLQQGIEHFVKEMLKYQAQHYTKADVEKMHKDGIQRLLPIIYTLDYSSLKTVKDIMFKDRSEEGVTKRNIFTELLPMAGTNPSAVLIKEMVLNNEFDSDNDAARAVTSVPFHIRKPNKELVKMYEELIVFSESGAEKFTKMAIPLAFAHLIRRTCELTTPHPYQKEENANNKYSQEKRDCVEQLLNPYVDMFYTKFDALNDETDHEQQDAYMMVFNNLRWGKVLDILKPIVLGEDKHSKNYALRTLAIFAISSVTIEEGVTREVMMPIFMDSAENHEIRIAAFDILMRGGIDSTVMSKIMKSMIVEKDHEVFNYVYTAFEKYAEDWHDPCGKNIEEFSRYFLKYWKQHMWMRPSYAFGVSKTYGKVFKKEKYGYSGSIEMHTTGSHKSTTPLSIMFDVRSQHFGHHTMQVFGGYIRIQGLAKQLLQKVKHMTYFNPQQWNVDELKSILFGQMSIRERPEVPVNVDLVLMMKDNVVFQRHYDESSVKAGGNLYQFFTDFVLLGQEYSINHQRGLMLGSVLYEQPTEIGVPMSYIAGITTVASMRAQINRSTDSGAFVRNIDYKIQFNTQAVNTMFVFNPSTKNVFSITQDRVYNHKFGSKLTALLNIPMKQVKLTIQRPEFGEPMSMMMHSQTVLSIRSNKLTSLQTELSRSCPHCQPEYTITKGGSYKKDRHFVNVDNEEWGFNLEGKYFDCEAPEAASSGEMFNVLIKAFNPMTKQPKDLFTAFTMGFRQIHSFLLYYPRVESCGMGLTWSQSKFNPVDKIDITLNANAKDIHRPDSIDNGKKMSVDGEIIFHGEVDRVHHVALKYEYEPMGQRNELAFKIVRNPFRLNSKEYPAYSICFDMNSRYPVDPKRTLYLDFTTDQKVKSDVALSWGQHSSCSNNPGRIQIVGEHQTTPESRQFLQTKWYYNTCMTQKQMPEYRSAVTLPFTDACFYTVLDLYTLRHYKWTAHFDGLEPWMVTGYRKLETLVKTGLFPFWKIDLDNSLSRKSKFIYSTSDVSSYSPEVVVEQIFHPQEETFDLTIQTNRDKNIFEGVNYGVWEWNAEPYKYMQEGGLPTFFALRNAKMSSFWTSLMANNIVNLCHATTSTIRTFDNVTYPYTMHNCKTLVSAHCAPVPTYAVFMAKSERFETHKKMDVDIHIGGHSVAIKPVTTTEYELKIDNQIVDLGQYETYYFPSNQKLGRSQETPANYKFKVYRLDGEYKVESFLNLKVVYDGAAVNVFAPASVKGQHCGMCGDFNGDHEHDLVHPDMCELANGDEMAAAWAWESAPGYPTSCPAKPACSYHERLLASRQTK